MARSAAAGDNTISRDDVIAFLDRYRGEDSEAEKIMGKAMKACKDGPRAKQKQIKDEVKEAGIRMRVFNALLKVRLGTDSARRAAKDLEDDDRDQFQELVANLTPEGVEPDLFAHAVIEAERFELSEE